MKNIKKEIDKKGYAIIKNLISKKEIREIFDSYEKNINYCLKLIKVQKKQQNIDSKYLLLKKKNNLLRERSYDLSKFQPSILKLAVNEKLNKILKGYFNEEFFIDLPQIRIDDNENSFLLPPHQELYGQISKDILTLWAPLSKVSKKMGTMGLIEGSHKGGVKKHVFYHVKNKKYHGISENIIKNSKFKYLNLSPGDAVLFHPLLIHTSLKNLSKKIRWTYVARYNGISGINYLKNLKSPLRIKQTAG
jgi:ectoine hydroxylase-related dioxygenase (phytanoyl-CoA dioxygenase family)